MLIKIEEKLENLKIGIMGSRKKLLADVLNQENITFTEIRAVQEIKQGFDIIFGSGIYDIIEEPYLNFPKYGLVFFHETLLPEGKGNAPLQWTVLNNRPNLTITAFKATKDMDAGDYLYQYNVALSPLNTLDDLEEKREYGIKECLRLILDEMKDGYMVLRKQAGQDSVSFKRTPKDSELDSDQTLLNLWDKIRICDNEKFPAFFKLHGKKIILRYEVVNE